MAVRTTQSATVSQQVGAHTPGPAKAALAITAVEDSLVLAVTQSHSMECPERGRELFMFTVIFISFSQGRLSPPTIHGFVTRLTDIHSVC